MKLLWDPVSSGLLQLLYPTWPQTLELNLHIWLSNVSLETMGRAFNNILDSGCRALLPFSQKSSGEVQHWCWVIRPGSQSLFQGGRLLVYGPGFVHGFKQERNQSKLLQQTWKCTIVWNVIVCCSVKISIILRGTVLIAALMYLGIGVQ